MRNEKRDSHNNNRKSQEKVANSLWIKHFDNQSYYIWCEDKNRRKNNINCKRKIGWSETWIVCDNFFHWFMLILNENVNISLLWVKKMFLMFFKGAIKYNTTNLTNIKKLTLEIAFAESYEKSQKNILNLFKIHQLYLIVRHSCFDSIIFC